MTDAASGPERSELRYPPATFNVAPRVFRPAADYVHDRALADEVQRLHDTRHYASAMQEVLDALDRDPEDQTACRMAALLWKSRTDSLRAEEPITEAQINDPRLDPVFSTCSRCERVRWVSLTYLLGDYERIGGTNVAGVQCHACGYVVCRTCLRGLPAPDACPNCRTGRLELAVFPNGRRRVQLERFVEPVRHIVVLRQGALPPSKDYLLRLLEQLCPEALAYRPKLSASFSGGAREGLHELCLPYLVKLEGEGNLAAPLSHYDCALVQDTDGDYVSIGRVMVDPSLCELVRTTLAAHVDRVEDARNRDVLQRMLRPRLLRYVQSIVSDGLMSFRDQADVHFDWFDVDQLAILVSVLPHSDTESMRRSFNGRYLPSLLKQCEDLGIFGQRHIAHWIVGLAGGRINVHLTWLPVPSSGLPALLALDLITAEEMTE